MKNNNQPLTPEEQARKERVRFRMFLLLVLLDFALVGYFLYEMLKIFVIK